MSLPFAAVGIVCTVLLIYVVGALSGAWGKGSLR
mgnify:CR=1 FL=1